MRIAVIAGTPIDTQMGVDLLTYAGYQEVLAVPISQSPAEQTLFQTIGYDERYSTLLSQMMQLKEQGYHAVFVYCNSLSGSVDFEALARDTHLKVVTPLQVYQDLAMDYQKLGIISANAQGLAGIEAIMFQENPQLQLLSISMLPLVEAIERQEASSSIATRFNFDAMVAFFEGNKVEGIVIGCTHFPYIMEELTLRTNLSIIDPAKEMIHKLTLP